MIVFLLPHCRPPSGTKTEESEILSIALSIVRSAGPVNAVVVVMVTIMLEKGKAMYFGSSILPCGFHPCSR
jgi:hypothetical protein